MKYRTRGQQKKPSPIGTPQGRHTLISLLGCAILGMVLSRVLPFILLKLRPQMTQAEADEVGVLIALGISGIVLVVSLLKTKRRGSSLHEHLLKEQEKSDGRF